MPSDNPLAEYLLRPSDRWTDAYLFLSTTRMRQLLILKTPQALREYAHCKTPQCSLVYIGFTAVICGHRQSVQRREIDGNSSPPDVVDEGHREMQINDAINSAT